MFKIVVKITSKIVFEQLYPAEITVKSWRDRDGTSLVFMSSLSRDVRVQNWPGPVDDSSLATARNSSSFYSVSSCSMETRLHLTLSWSWVSPGPSPGSDPVLAPDWELDSVSVSAVWFSGSGVDFTDG